MLDIKKAQIGNKTEIVLSGVVDEYSKLERISTASAQEISVNCRGVTRINSPGVKDWKRFFESQRELGIKLSFSEISPALITQFNFITGLINKEECLSICMPFVCEQCHADIIKIYPVSLTSKTEFKDLKEVCSKCSNLLEFNENFDEYSTFFR